MDLAEVLDELGVGHAVTIEPHAGSGAYGDTWGPPVPVAPCFVDETRRVLRAPDGSQVVSQATVLAPLATACPARSRVTLPDGRQTLVISTTRQDGGGLDVPEHLDIACE